MDSRLRGNDNRKVDYATLPIQGSVNRKGQKMRSQIMRIGIVTGLLTAVVGVMSIAQGGGAVVEVIKPDLQGGAKVTISGNVGIPGAILTGLPGNPVSKADGSYEATVPLGWSGKVRPTKPGYVFEPTTRTYDDVTIRDVGMLNDQDYVARVVQPARREPVVSEQRVLVIPTAEPNVEIVAEVSEDLHVMLEILKEQFAEGPGMIQGVFTDFGDFFGQGCRQPQAMYIQGYGALFVLETRVPIAPPKAERPVGPAGGTEPNQPPADPVWQRVKQRYSPSYAGASEQDQADGAAITIDDIKEDIIKTLKHASNIRHIEGGETIVVTVVCSGQDAGLQFRYGFSQPVVPGRETTGSVAGGYGTSTSSRRRSSGTAGGGGFGVGGSVGGYVGDGMYSEMMYGGGAERGLGAIGAAATVLTIQVKKSDVDTFAQGKMDAGLFHKAVRIFMY